jgi:hypothetical protein
MVKVRARVRRELAVISSHSRAVNRYIKFSLQLDELHRQLTPADHAEARRRLARERRALRALRTT